MMRYYGRGFDVASGGAGLMGHIVGLVIMCVIIALVITAVVLIVRSLKRGGYHAGHFAPTATTNEALNILNERYAKGEITEEEYKKMKLNLMG